ncbi:MAG TPA: hypothetical protein VK929_12500 [Longimicrobiales bacterium]|nr:hypothetical protein [Longimicrobiales bacterium]
MGPVTGGLQTRRAAIGRIGEGRRRWRVMVETWQETEDYCGRLLFCPDGAEPAPERESAALLRGRSHEDILNRAHELPEERLRRLLLSLG